MDEYKRTRLEAKLEAYELVCREILDAERHMNDDEEWVRGHVNGLKEARNRVEEAIFNEVNNG